MTYPRWNPVVTLLAGGVVTVTSSACVDPVAKPQAEATATDGETSSRSTGGTEIIASTTAAIDEDENTAQESEPGETPLPTWNAHYYENVQIRPSPWMELETIDPPAKLEFEVYAEPKAEPDTSLQTIAGEPYVFIASAEAQSIYQVSLVTGQAIVLLDEADGLVAPRGLAQSDQGLWWSDPGRGSISTLLWRGEDDYRYELYLDRVIVDGLGVMASSAEDVFFYHSGTRSILSHHYGGLYFEVVESIVVVVDEIDEVRSMAATHDGKFLYWTQSGSPHIWRVPTVGNTKTDEVDREIVVENAGANGISILGDWLVYSVGDGAGQIFHNVNEKFEPPKDIDERPLDTPEFFAPIVLLPGIEDVFTDQVTVSADQLDGKLFTADRAAGLHSLVMSGLPSISAMTRNWCTTETWGYSGFVPVGVDDERAAVVCK